MGIQNLLYCCLLSVPYGAVLIRYYTVRVRYLNTGIIPQYCSSIIHLQVNKVHVRVRLRMCSIKRKTYDTRNL